MKPIIMIVAALLIAFFAYIYLQPKLSSNDTLTTTSSENTDNVVFSEEELANIPPTYNESVANTDLEIVAPIADYSSPVETTAPSPKTTTPTQAFVCDGRKHCSQMRSCAEATYFSNNCPGTKMDGNNDGIPCEQQWCY